MSTPSTPGTPVTQQAEPKTIESLQPQIVWRYFHELTQVPRPSKNEDQIQAFAMRRGEELGFEVRRDDTGNIVMDVPATPGHEGAPTVVLQGHLDMVAEKNAGTDHDFDNDPIRTVIDTDEETREPIVRADGTTLGADNGIGVALALAAATDPDCAHGPLEILCTSDEEMGMTGAKALEPNFFRGRIMINLDSEEDDAIYIGCAGGTDVTLTWTLDLEPVPSGHELIRVAVAGLRGGHSGDNIHFNRTNAIKLLADVLTLEAIDDLRLVDFVGGSKRNAIPREGYAIIAAPRGAIDSLRKAAERLELAAKRTNGERNCSILVEPDKVGHDVAAAPGLSRQLLTAIAALPSGPLAIVPEIPGLVQTSSNVSTASCTKKGDTIRIEVGCLSRSSAGDQLKATVRQLTAIGRLGGAHVEAGNEYPGWQPNVNSPTLEVSKRVYEDLFGEAAKVTAIHAGLECGIIGERVGEIDMVSIGPRIEGAHSPDERVWIDSVDKMYRYLKAVLAELAKK
jgi:dipeptidase D